MNYQEDECSICLDELKNSNEAIYVLECSHKYHELCLNLWYNQRGTNYTCPLCMVPREITKIIYSNILEEPIENNSSKYQPNTNINEINLELDFNFTPPQLENVSLFPREISNRQSKKKNNCVIS